MGPMSLLRPARLRAARPAFTLIELIIAVVILAVLATIAIPTFARDITNASLAKEGASLNALANDALTIARSKNETVPTIADLTLAAGEMPALTAANGSAPRYVLTAAGTTYTFVTSSQASASPSSTYGTVSADVADSTSYVGLAMATANGDCVMDRISASRTEVWSYAMNLGSNCDGSVSLAGPAQPTPVPGTTTTAAPTTTTTSPGAWTMVGASTTNSPWGTALSVPANGYAYTNLGVTATSITFEIQVQTEGDVFFNASSGGQGVFARDETRSGDYSGFAPTNSWTSWVAPMDAPQLAAGTWYSYAITISGGQASLSINGTQYASNFPASAVGTYLGVGGDAVSGNTLVANLKVNGAAVVMP